MSQPIVFYDIPNGLSIDQRSWTPNLLRGRCESTNRHAQMMLIGVKQRLALNYKRIPYKTVWVGLADVQTASKKIGSTPTTTYADGTPRYTLPTIYDPNTDRVVTDSVAIAQYLDKQYPEHPLFPNGTADVQVAFAGTALSLIGAVRHSPKSIMQHGCSYTLRIPGSSVFCARGRI
jgi:hypothetical protein